jgi:phenylalanyl-tRNA synthetase beta chain
VKFTLSWLRTHLETEASLDEITLRLTAIGHEVENVENPAAKLAGFCIARVLSAAPHPQADKLQVLSVHAGPKFNNGAPIQVVCGAPNARAGMVGVFGAAGAVVPANGMELRVAAIRGVESNGMMCSARELELGEDHDGILDLPADSPIGESFAHWSGMDDPVIDVAITPNRQDCMGVRGLARDLAAAGIGTLKPLAVPHIESAKPGPDVRTDDPAGCPAFFARSIHNVNNGVSPRWMQARLRAIGQRPISALVDITNYVMIDLGRPLHVYDMAKLNGGLVARQAQGGEQLTALNGKSYTLSAGMTVIGDATGVHDIGGIMGGEQTGASDNTTDVLIECAYFTPDSVARTGQKLALSSDARTRFERGVDPAFLDDGLSIATQYVVDLCGGTPSQATRAGSAPDTLRTLEYIPTACLALAGLDVPLPRQKEILEALGFGVSGGEAWVITIPSWRRDVSCSADIVEEIIRIAGLDAIPSTPLPRTDAVAKSVLTPLQRTERSARRAAAAHGLHEAITWTFLPPSQADAFGGADWTLANPISADMAAMRPSLLPGLLSAAARNLNHGINGVRLFEIGRRYFRADDGSSDERLTLSIILAGVAQDRHWQDGKAARFDSFDAKAAALAILEAAGAPVHNLQVLAEAAAHYHPGQSGTLALGPKNRIATFGVLHPGLARQFDLDGPIAMAEIDLEAIPTKRSSGTAKPPYAPPALQAVTRDFAFLSSADLPAADIIRAVRSADKANISAVALFDDFRGQGVPEGQKSLGLEVTLQPHDKSFDDAALKAISDSIIASAAKIGAVLRG